MPGIEVRRIIGVEDELGHLLRGVGLRIGVGLRVEILGYGGLEDGGGGGGGGAGFEGYGEVEEGGGGAGVGVG